MKNSKFRKIFAAALFFAVIGIVSILNVPFVKAVDFSAPSIIVSLDSSSPSSKTITAGSAEVVMLSFKISNTYNREVNVTNISLSMTGTATPDDITKVYLFDGINLLGSSGLGRGGSGYNFTSFGTDSQSCYPKCPSFVLIPANSSKVITVKADIASTLSANQITSSLSSDLFTAERLPVSGVPVTGNMMTIIGNVFPPSITLLSPNGGEVWQASSTQTIKWLSNGLPTTDKMNIYLYNESSAIPALPTLIGLLTANDGSELWVMPSYLVPGDKYRIEIKKADNVLINDKSDGPFSIVAASGGGGGGGGSTLTPSDSDSSPDYNKTPLSFITSEKYPDFFTAGVGTGIYLGASPTFHQIYGLEPDPLTPKPTDKPYSTFYDHCANSSQLNEAFITTDGKLGALGVSPPVGYTCSKGAFVPYTTQPSITVLSPNGGETINFSKVYSIKWNYSNLYQVSLALYRDGSFFNWIAYNISIPSADNAAASYDWAPSQTISEANISGSFKIYILGYKTAGGQVEDYSDAPFSIVAASTLPDLVINDLQTADENGQSYLKFVIGNTGAATRNGQIISVKAEDLETGYIYSSGYSNSLASTTKILSSKPLITKNPDVANYKLRATIDYANIINESNENNNTLEKTLSVPINTDSSIISEQVTCLFKGAQYEQKCYAASHDNGNISCSGKKSCVTDIKRAKSESVTWKSTCGGYAYTTMDGKNELAEFNCAVVSTLSPKSTFSASPTRPPEPEIIDMKYKAKDMVDDKYDAILSELKQLRDIIKEQQNEIKYLKSMTNDLRNISDQMKSAINDFITYGVDANTVKLGAGERAAVINSYKTAFDKLPETEAELTDVIKIANGRFPSITSNRAEKQAKEQFIKIYKRIADMNNANDNAALKVVAYGLRQKAENRNLNSERSGIKIFKNIYGRLPKTTADWNIMQAITYSGASR